MKGFSFVLVILFVIAVLPLLSIESKIVLDTARLNARIIEHQHMKNIRDDILRTFSEMAMDCKKSNNDKICALYFSEWSNYWKSRGFRILSGEITYIHGVPHLAKQVDPRVIGGTLVPSRNISSFGILLEGKGMKVLINRGLWA